MGLFSGMNVSSSGMTAQRLRMDLISNNIANINTTRTDDGGPYKKKSPVFKAKNDQGFSLPNSDAQSNQVGQGVEVSSIKESSKPPKLVYNPQHPDANEEGYVEMPNIDIASEMVDMVSASRAYEANVTALNTSKQMAKSALKIGK
ncbi:flagellar basal body rod protein FlgC [Acetohalobium arabaticum]|uniref:Flagellar basal-body rod protein FlgC n=1 Tax=Acetohalobium arabaticum (strain ATCC 49924 / DSM 5501 / Z-7288) TaxID=574087 RepID=D9QRL2_ACEAZ|nr:flagellar basal body rod protein FlgC [Acetohalobium arabaticum]ADL13153.1 flagellar basal-body rod protein FlgC [Acetohalobium arabaticum DSM 5501]